MATKAVPVPAAEPPAIAEHHLRLPDGLLEVLQGRAAHAEGLTGRGIRVAIIDSGFFPHPFYQERGYRIRLIPTEREPDPSLDEYGHGTAQLASLVSVAPEAEVLAVKCMDRDPTAALRTAIALAPHVLCLAWGYNIDGANRRRLPEEYEGIRELIASAVAGGITVVAAAGNGQRCFPGNMPEVISAGGVYYRPDGGFEHSDLSSDYESGIFEKRSVPDLCGPVGNRPYGRLLLVPVPPQASLARRRSFRALAATAMGGARPAPLPGWALFSGTSAATAMVSGAAALLLQMRPGLAPAALKRILVDSSRTVCGAPAAEARGASRILSLDRALAMLP